MIFDKFLEMRSKEVLKADLQSLAIAAMLVATKYEEIYPPSVREMIKISGDSKILKAEILKMESTILSALEFDFTFPTCYRFLERFAKLTNGDDYVISHASYLLELA
jgi:cyclin B